MVARQFKVRSREELMNFPEPKFLVTSVLPEKSLSLLVGPPGVGKSFIALDLCLSISCSIPWLDFEIPTPGRVVYLTAEGISGLKLRVAAWESYHGIQASNFQYICEAPQFLNSAEVNSLIAAIKSANPCNPVLIVVDTLARHMVGGDENSSKEMGQFIASAAKLSETLNCAVIIVHHTGKKTGTKTFNERGSSALRGAADTMLFMDKSKNQITLKCDKQKDSEPFADISISLKQVKLLNSQSSCVPIRDAKSLSNPPTLPSEKQKIISALNGQTAGLKTKDLLAMTGIPESSYHRHRKDLCDEGYIIEQDSYYLLTGKGKEHALTLNQLSTNSHESITTTPSTPTPL